MSKITSFCVVLLLGLTSVSAARRRLNSISELINFHQGERTNVLELLRWFANRVNIHNNVIKLTFDPNRDYGSHHYGNHENVLDPQPQGFRYYTVGNIHQDTSESLPLYVRDAQRGTNGWNRARIIFSARDRQIDRVFITQHYGSSDDTSYNPHFTFEVTVDLLQEFRRQQQYTYAQQSGSYGNTSHLQGSVYSNPHRFTSQPDINNGMDCQKFCIALVLILLVIFALIVITSSAKMGKY